MRISLIALLLFIVFSLILANSAFSFSNNYIELNLNNKEIKLVDFNCGKFTLTGDFFFKNYEEQGSLVQEIEGRGIILRPNLAIPEAVKEHRISWLTLKTVKQGSIIFIERLSLPQGLIKGSFDLANRSFSLDIEGGWYAVTKFLNGHLKMKGKAWGDINNFSVSGYLTIDEGVYKGLEFSHLRLDVLGKPPVLNITDSEFILPSGTVATLAGDKVLDLRNLYNYIPEAEYRAKKAYIDNWQLFSEDETRFGFKKSLDENIDVSFGASQEETSAPETELRYNVQGDNFIKFKMQENSSVIGVEKRKDF